MFAVLLFFIGFIAGLWWLYDSLPLAVLINNISQKKANMDMPDKISASSNSAFQTADSSLFKPVSLTIGVLNDSRKNTVSKITEISREEIKNNILIGLRRNRKSYVNNYTFSCKRDYLDSLPVIDSEIIRKRVRSIHQKCSEQHSSPLSSKSEIVNSLQLKQNFYSAYNNKTIYQVPLLASIPAQVQGKEKVDKDRLQSSSVVDLTEEVFVPEVKEYSDLFFQGKLDIQQGIKKVKKQPIITTVDLPYAVLSNANEETVTDVLLISNRENQSLIDSENCALFNGGLSRETDYYLTDVRQIYSNGLNLLEPPTLLHHVDIEKLSLKDNFKVLESSSFRFKKPLYLPPLGLLLEPDLNMGCLLDDATLIGTGQLIEEKLAEFKVRVTVIDASTGPVVTRYEIEPATGVRGNQIVNLAKDLARSMGVMSMRVVETIPGKTCMGLELPNPRRQIIRLYQVFSSELFQNANSHLTLALGHDIVGQPVIMDLEKAPHLLVAGTTGSGKSVGVNAMILSMLYKATPDEVRMIMIDPKMLELSVYNDIPHLLCPVVTDMKLASNALSWCVNEMERRYRLMSALGVRSLKGFNDKVTLARDKGTAITNPFSMRDDSELLDILPSIVVIVDEFADLMMVAGKKIEELIARLAQKARAAGIHLILATQRPSVDVITGLIKANIPTRIAFQVSSKIDSRTILDQMGAESLLGQGDMLFLPPGVAYPRRVHGAFVDDEEVHRVVEYLKQFGEPDYIEDLLFSTDVNNENNEGTLKENNVENDPLYDKAVEIVIKTRRASISSVQRQLRIGYNRAARLIEQMESAGIVSGIGGHGSRTVLIPEQE